jgi:hypothetical protein
MSDTWKFSFVPRVFGGEKEAQNVWWLSKILFYSLP